MKEFYSHGKLLLTGEYAVLDGAWALAVPTKKGQRMRCFSSKDDVFRWKSFDNQGDVWLDLELFSSGETSKEQQVLEKILLTARQMNPKFLRSHRLCVETHLEFPRQWGWGSSSTIINNIARWAGVDAYELLWKSFGGSGYDIACAQNDTPVLYRVSQEKVDCYPVEFRPPFSDKLFFVYLNKKQSSKEGILHYKSLKNSKKILVEQIDEITENCLRVQTLSDFSLLMQQHETILSKILGIPPVKEHLFPDYEGVVKSLGAWGGDFVWVTGTRSEVLSYFEQKGFSTILSFDEVVL